jgi:hypothetical protein
MLLCVVLCEQKNSVRRNVSFDEALGQTGDVGEFAVHDAMNLVLDIGSGDALFGADVEIGDVWLGCRHSTRGLVVTAR